jgi:hypothetical protein
MKKFILLLILITTLPVSALNWDYNADIFVDYQDLYYFADGWLDDNDFVDFSEFAIEWKLPIINIDLCVENGNNILCGSFYLEYCNCKPNCSFFISECGEYYINYYYLSWLEFDDGFIQYTGSKIEVFKIVEVEPGIYDSLLIFRDTNELQACHVFETPEVGSGTAYIDEFSITVYR